MRCASSVVPSFVAVRRTSRAGCLRPSLAVFVADRASAGHARHRASRWCAPALRVRCLPVSSGAPASLACLRPRPSYITRRCALAAPVRAARRTTRRYAKWPQHRPCAHQGAALPALRLPAPARCASARRPWLASVASCVCLRARPARARGGLTAARFNPVLSLSKGRPLSKA